MFYLSLVFVLVRLLPVAAETADPDVATRCVIVTNQDWAVMAADTVSGYINRLLGGVQAHS